MLTASSDNAVDGTAGPDTISSNHLTIQNTDIIKGGAGTDTLTILNTGAALSIAPAILTDVENIQVTSSSGSTSSAVNLIAATGVEKVISKSSVAADTFSNLQTAAAVEIDGSTSDVTASYKNSLLSGTADTLSLTVKGGSDLGTVTLQGATASNVVETLNLVSSGATANAIDSIVSNSAAIGTINVSGSANLTMGTGTAFGSGDVLINKLDASAFTGNLTAYVDENSGKAYSVIGGTGDDTIYLDGVDAFYNADNGNGTGNKVTSIVGGAGNDTLLVDASLIASQLVTTTADTADNVLSGVETLKLVASGTTGTVTIDASVSADITSVVTEVTNSTSSSGGATEITNAITNIKAQSISAKGTSGVDANDTVALSLKVYDGSSANTTLTATLAGTFNTVTATDATDDAATTATGADESGAAENVAITTGATNLTVASLAAAGAFGLTLSGEKNITISAADLGTTNTSNTATTDDVVTINAAALTGNLDLTKSEAGVYSITTGAGTNALRLGAYSDDTTVVGGGTETVYVTDTAGGANTVNLNLTAVETLAIDTTSSGDDTFTMAAVAAGTTVKLVDAVDGAGFAVALSNINGQTVEVVTQEKASASLSSDTDDVDFSGVVITAGKATAATGVSLKVSGAAQEATATSSFAGIFKTTGVATVNSAVASSTYALNLNLDFDGVSATDKLTGLVLTGGGAASASANTTITVATNDSHVNLTSLDATGYTGNVVASSMAFDSSTSAASISLASVQNITLAAAELARDQLSITGGSGANTVIAASVGASGTESLRPAMTSVETVDLTLVNTSDVDTVLELRDASSVTTVKLGVTETSTASDAQAFASDIEIANLANNGTLQLNAASTGDTTYGYDGGGTAANAEGIAVNSAITRATALNVNNTGAAAAVIVAGAAGYGGLALGSTYTTLNVDGVTTGALTFARVYGAGLTTVNLENNTTASSGALTVSELEAAALTALNIDSTKGAVTVSDLNTMNSLETLAVNTGVAASGGKTTITAGTSTSIDAITASGTGAFEITALSASSLDSIDASGVTGAVTLGSTTSSALTTAAGASIVTGTANDIVSVNSSTLGTVTLGSVTNSDGVLTDNDTLYLIGAQGSGTGVIDLSQSGDQILTINGQTNTTVQTGIDSVNVASMTSANSYGWTITARAADSSITGSGYNDVINGGAGADTLGGGAGADTIATNGGGDSVTGGTGADTITLGTGADTVNFANGDSIEAGYDNVTGFTVASDILNLAATTVTSLASGSAVTVGGVVDGVAGTVTAYSVTGKIALLGANAANVNALAEWIDIAELIASGVDVTANTTAYQTLAFEFGGNTYVVQTKTVDASGAETVTTEAVIELVGLTSVSALSTSAASNTIVLA
jgi:trimeric autotransporter adhesin